MSISLPKYIKNILKYFFILFVLSCEKKIDNSKKSITIERFENLFYESSIDDLDKLKKKYPYFFPNEFPDSAWENRLKDSIQLEIYEEIKKNYTSLKFLEISLYDFFEKHKKLNQDFKEPKIFSIVSDLDFSNRVILNDSILLIGLDNYLGPNHHFYEGIPKYIKEDFKRNNIISDVAEKFAKKVIPRNKIYTFLDKIIYNGKILYYKDFSLGNSLEDRFKIGYSDSKMKWAKDNEYFVWKFFIQNDILFNPDNKLNNRFINDAPFSRFYLELDNKSSEMIGKYIGWQIVISYMKNNNVNILDMIKTDAIDIYNNSKYKPNKK
tara:strand:+ start:2095 stop:3063 length:969 start_codon:yes stop_codon:yes gene_type:complete